MGSGLGIGLGLGRLSSEGTMIEATVERAKRITPPSCHGLGLVRVGLGAGIRVGCGLG